MPCHSPLRLDAVGGERDAEIDEVDDFGIGHLETAKAASRNLGDQWVHSYIWMHACRKLGELGSIQT